MSEASNSTLKYGTDRLGALNATRDFPSGTVGYGVNQAIDLLYNGISSEYILKGYSYGGWGNKFSAKIGTLFQAPEMQELMKKPSSDYTAQLEVAKKEVHYWRTVLDDKNSSYDDKIGAIIALQFSPETRAEFQQSFSDGRDDLFETLNVYRKIPGFVNLLGNSELPDYVKKEFIEFYQKLELSNEKDKPKKLLGFIQQKFFELNNDFNFPMCFTAETPILMSDGTNKPIAEIQIGDEVMAFKGLGELQPRKVTNTFTTPNQKVVQLGNIKVTLEHHFLQPDGSFKALGEIDTNGFLVGVTGKLIPHPGIQPVTGEHTVYNFTVEELHTYIAGGLRVHNDCVEDGDIITNRQFLPDGTVIYTGQNRYGSKLTVSEQYDPISKEMVVVERNISFASGDAVVTNRWSRADGQIDSNNNVIGEPVIEVAFPSAVITGEQIGATFGSTLGQSLAGNNVFAQIGAGSTLSTLLSNVGETLHIYFNDSPVRDTPGSVPPSLEKSSEIAFNDFSKDLFAELKAQSISAVSSFLVAELSDALDVGNSFGGQLFSTATGAVTRTVISNALNPQATSLFTGLGSGVVTSVSGFLGNYLANEILSPSSASGALGGSIGSALGSTIGFGLSAWGGAAANAVGISVGQTIGLAGSLSTWGMFGNFILPGIGALVGTLVGTLLGDWIDEQWGDEARAWASLQIDPTSGEFYLSDTWRKEGGNKRFAIEMAEASRDVLNNYLGVIDGVHIATDQLYHRYGHREEKLYVNFRDELHGNKEINRKTPEHIINLGVIDTLKRLRLAGGEMMMKRVIEKTQATTIKDLNADLQIAQDYARYLENKDTIDLLIASDPNSAFAAGWVITLIRAEEIGITDWSESDFYGGLGAFFKGLGLDKTGITLNNLTISLQGTTLKLEVVIDGEVVRTIEIADIENKVGYKHLAANATGATVNGTAGNDIWIAQDVASTFIDSGTANEGESNDILVGGSANDTINAGLGWDFVRGNGGNDLIVGGAGNDILYGGDGADTIHGDENVGFAAIPTGIDLSDGATSNAKPVSDVTRQTWFGGDLSAPKYQQYPTSTTEDGSIPGGGSTNTQLIFRNDEVHGGAGNDRIAGGEGDDRLYGDADIDTLYGDAGNDFLEGGNGADVVYGGAGYDVVSYASATAGVTVDLAGGTFKGTASDGDELYSIEDILGSAFNDILRGDAFANIIDGGAGADVIDGRSGRDAVSFFSENYGVEVDLSAGQAKVRIPGAKGNPDTVITDTLLNIEDVIGSCHDDTLKGSVAGGLLEGGAGNDIIYVKSDDVDVAGGAAASDIRGGEGFDTLSFAEWSKARGITINLKGTTNGHKISSIEKVIGSAQADTITGTEAAEIFEGGRGNDVFDGKGSSDVFVLNRGDGNDFLKAVQEEIGSNGFVEKVVYGAAEVDEDVIVFGQNITYHDIFGSVAAINQDQVKLQSDRYSYDGSTLSKQQLTERLNSFDLLIGVKSANSYIPQTANLISNLEYSIRVQAGGVLTGFVSKGQELAAVNLSGLLVENGKIQAREYSFDTSAGKVKRLGFGNSAHIDFGHVKYFKDGSAGADTLAADAGKGSWLFGGALNDIITGSNKGDIIVGGTDNDLLQGGEGDDQYAYWLGDGHDIITDFAGADTIVFGGGIGTEQIKLKIGKLNNPAEPTSFRQASEGEFQRDLKIEIYNPNTNALSGSITIIDFQAHLNAKDRLRFAGDVELTFAEILKNQGITLLPRHVGSAGNDTLTGGDEAEEFFGLAGNDTMRGGKGDDVFFAHLGADSINGDDGLDTVDYEFATGPVTINLSTSRVTEPGNVTDVLSSIENAGGSAFNDTITGSNSDNILAGRAGDDIINANGGNDTLLGGEGNDQLNGGDQDDLIYGDGGNDTIDGGKGIDTVNYGAFTSSVTVNLLLGTAVTTFLKGSSAIIETDTLKNIESVIGTDLNDTLVGNTSTKQLDGGAGNDTFVIQNDDVDVAAGAAAISLMGGLGEDTLSFASWTKARGVTINLGNTPPEGRGADLPNLYNSIEKVIGSALDDNITGSNRNETLEGGSGNDILIGGLGADRLIGGAGWDIARYRNASEGVSINLLTGQGRGGEAEGDTFFEIEQVDGSNYADILVGDANDNVFYGGSGNDVLSGGAGNDKLIGALGIDSFDGGEGSDTVDFSDGGNGIVADLMSGVAIETSVGQVTKITISHLPTGVVVSHGVNAGNGRWTLTPEEFLRLTLTPPPGLESFEFQAAATVVEASGAVVERIGTLQAQRTEGALGMRLKGVTMQQTFETGASGWNLNDLTDGGVSFTKFLGRTGGKQDTGIFRTFALPGTQDKVTVEFDFYEFDSWDNERLIVNVNDLEVANGRFSHNSADNDHTSSTPLTNPQNLGLGRHSDQIHRFSFTLPVTGDTLTLRIRSWLDDKISDESYGIDNVRITPQVPSHASALYMKRPADILAGLVGSAVENLSSIESINGTNHADRLSGDAGSNILIGNAGNDILTGFKGFDQLEGGNGNDIYQFSKGDGQDVITEISGTDRLEFGGINASALWFAKDNNNLVISHLGTTDKVTVTNWFSNVNNQIETIKAFGSNQELYAAGVNTLISRMAPFASLLGSDPSTINPNNLLPEYLTTVNSTWTLSS